MRNVEHVAVVSTEAGNLTLDQAQIPERLGRRSGVLPGLVPFEPPWPHAAERPELALVDMRLDRSRSSYVAKSLSFGLAQRSDDASHLRSVAHHPRQQSHNLVRLLIGQRQAPAFGNCLEQHQRVFTQRVAQEPDHSQIINQPP